MIGRSLVICRPVAMMLMHENAAVTVCRSRTADIPSVTKEAGIVIAASPAAWGSVTTSVLVSHVVEAAKRAAFYSRA